MPVLQVTSSHPTTFTGAQAGVPTGQKFTVKNVGKNTVFFQFGREASSGDKAGELTENAPSFVYIDPVALATAGKETKLTLTMDVTTNAVAPTASFIGGLYKLTKSAGGTEKKLEYELDPILAGSATPTITTPAKESN